MDLKKLTNITLDSAKIDKLTVWNNSLNLKGKALSINQLPLSEGVIEIPVSDTGIGSLLHIYFKDVERRIMTEIYIDEKFFTQWFINYQQLPLSTAGSALESLPNNLQQVELIRQMSSLLAYVMCFISAYRQYPKIVCESKKTIILNFDGKFPELQISKNPLVTQRGIELLKIKVDPQKSLHDQTKIYFNDFYKRWIAEPIPALQGKTPFEASKTPEGRKQLYDLLEHIRKKPSTVPFPYEEIKKNLGL